MSLLVNGQCAHRLMAVGNRCLDLAITTRAIKHRPDVVYDIPLCEYHAQLFDTHHGEGPPCPE